MEKLTIKEFDQKVASAFLNCTKMQKKKIAFKFNTPYNFVTGQAYRGVQRVLLPSGGYATFNQIAAAGGKVKKGAKAVQLTFIKEVKKTSKKAFKGAKLDKKTGLYTAVSIEPKSFNLFKLEDVEGIKPIIPTPLMTSEVKQKAIELVGGYDDYAHTLIMLINTIEDSNISFPIVNAHKAIDLIEADPTMARKALDHAEELINKAIELVHNEHTEDQGVTLDQVLADFDKEQKAEPKTATKKAGQKSRGKKSEVETIKSRASIPSAPKSPKAAALGFSIDGWGMGSYNCSMDFSKIGA